MEKEAKKEAFRKNLEFTEVLDALINVLVALYKQNDKPSSAIEIAGSSYAAYVGFHMELVSKFHPSCMGMTIEEAKKLEKFLCSDCASDEDTKKSLNSFPVSPSVEAKVEPKRRKR